LPAEELDRISNEQIELIVPIQLGSDGPESLLVLELKRSEEPYSREDERLLSAIAASLALLSTRTPNTTPETFWRVFAHVCTTGQWLVAM
jgi:hypothetical protein